MLSSLNSKDGVRREVEKVICQGSGFSHVKQGALERLFADFGGILTKERTQSLFSLPTCKC